MSTVTTFVRFAFAAVFVNAVAVACVASDDDDDPQVTCEPGELLACECKSGATGTKKCNASGTGTAQCVCAGEPGSGGAGGSDGDTGGVGNRPSGGAGGDVTTGGVDAGGAGGIDAGGAGGIDAGGAGGINAGGAGGAGDGTPLVCTDPVDSCEDCYFSCCDEWVACTDDASCPDEFFDILACTDLIRVDRNVTIADLADCSDQVGTVGGAWSSGLTAQTVAMVNCLGGDPSSDTWSTEAAWPADSCNEGCFKHD